MQSAGDSAPPRTSSASAWTDFVAGTAAGIAGLVAGHPFDTVKTRLQSPSVAGRYTGARDAFRIIFRDEKLAGLYKGITSPMLGVAAMNASVFGMYGLLLRCQGTSESSKAGLGQVMLAGMASGVVSALITTPIELIKIRQQNVIDTDHGHLTTARRQRTSGARTIDVVRDIVRRHGVSGLWRGLTATALRDLGYGPYFVAYEAICRLCLSLHAVSPAHVLPSSSTHALPSSPTHALYASEPSVSVSSFTPSATPSSSSPPYLTLTPLELAVAGGLAGVVSWTVTFGMDVVKTRVQAAQPPSLSSSSSSSLAGVRVLDERGRFMTPTAAGQSHSNQSLSRASSPSSLRPGRRREATPRPRPLGSETLATALESYRRGGWRVFFTGWTTTVVRAIPVNAATFVVFETTARFLRDVSS